MPRLLEDHGGSVLVEFPDGYRQEMLKSAYEAAFPGGSYPTDDPTGALTRDNLLGAAAAPPAGPIAPAPAPPPELERPGPAPLVVAPPAVQPNPAPAFLSPLELGARAIGAGSAGGQPSRPDAEPAFQAMPDESQLVGPSLGGVAIPEGADEPIGAAPAPSMPLKPAAAPAQVGASTRPPRPPGLQSLAEFDEAIQDYGVEKTSAVTDLARIESDELKRNAKLLDTHNAEMDRLAAQKQADREAGLALAEKRWAEVETMSKRIDEAKVDRGRLWKNMSTGNKILAGIGLALSAIGQAKSRQGGQNPALGIIMQAIEDDVADQRAAIDKMGADAGRSRGLYSEILGQTKNRDLAWDLTLAESAQKVQREFEAYALHAGSERAQVQARDAAAEIARTVAQLREGARQTNYDAVLREHEKQMALLRKARGAGGGGARAAAAGVGSSGPQGVWTKGEGKPIEMAVGPGSKFYDQVGYFGDQPFLAGTAEEAEKVTDSYSQTQSAINNLSTLRANADKLGFADDYFITKSEISKMAGVDEVFALMEMKDAFGLGVLSGTDADLLKSLTAGGKAKWGDIKNILRTTEENLEKRFIERSRAKGYKGPIQFNRAERPPPPQSWDKSARHVMDKRLTRKDRMGNIDRMLVGLKSQKEFDAATKANVVSSVLETVTAERVAAKAELDAAMAQNDDGGIITADVVEKAKARYSTANAVHGRLTKAREDFAAKAARLRRDEEREKERAERERARGDFSVGGVMRTGGK